MILKGQNHRAHYFFLFLSLIFIISSCQVPRLSKTTIIRLKGSDTMHILARAWAADYMRSHPHVSVYVTGGGSAVGFRALSAGEIDIALASRLIRSEEAQMLAERYGKIGISFLVAKDALSIYLNPENPVGNLTLEQIADIFSGHIRNWQAVGGLNEPIMVVLRPPTSGTYFYLKEHILHDESYLKDAVTIPTTNEITRFIAAHRNAIGYGGLAYGRNVKHCRINGIAALEKEVRNGRYPLIRYLYLYTIDKPQGETKRFIDYVLSPAGQRIVEKIGYIPIFPMEE